MKEHDKVSIIKDMNIETTYDGSIDDLELIQRCQQGDINAKEILIKNNVMFIKNIIEKYFSNYSYDYNELFVIGIEAFSDSIDSFDINKGKKLSTYAYYCVRGRIANFIRDEASSKNLEDNMLNEYSDDEELPASFIEQDFMLENLLDDEQKELKIQILYDYISKLSDIDRFILVKYYGLANNHKPMTLTQIGEALGISHSAVSQRRNRMLREMKRYIVGQMNDKYFTERNQKISAFLNKIRQQVRQKESQLACKKSRKM